MSQTMHCTLFLHQASVCFEMLDAFLVGPFADTL